MGSIIEDNTRSLYREQERKEIDIEIDPQPLVYHHIGILKKVKGCKQ